mgnify:CR=1 FL=1
MSVENFGEKFFRTRDNGLESREVWKFRHGHTLLGSTFHIHAIRSLHDFSIEDLQWMLLEAVSLPEPTDLQIHFQIPIDIKLYVNDEYETRNFAGVVNSLIGSGFSPITINMHLESTGTGWIRVALFGANDLPDNPKINRPSNSLLC